MDAGKLADGLVLDENSIKICETCSGRGVLMFENDVRDIRQRFALGGEIS